MHLRRKSRTWCEKAFALQLWQVHVKSCNASVRSVTGHFGHKTLRTRMRHFGTVSRHFCTKNVVRDTSTSDQRKVGTLWTKDYSDKTLDTAPPVVRLKVGAEVSCGRSVRLPCVLTPAFPHQVYLSNVNDAAGRPSASNLLHLATRRPSP